MADTYSQTCKTCGALLDELIAKSQNGLVTCPYCQNVWTIPKKETTPAALSYLRNGEVNLDTCHFDDAFTAFQKAAELDPKEPEAYFGMARATFRVQFLTDTLQKPPRTQPICHEISEKVFTQDKNYQKALSLATQEQVKTYKQLGETIDSIRKQFYELKQSGLSYDCFLCVKVSDGQGGTTQDSHDALRLYNHLQSKGFSPFYSEEETKGRSGAAYEALILYALCSSKCMLIVCRDESYLQTPWVKNEYTRFSQMIAREDKDKNAITFVYHGTPIERLPGREWRIQGIDLTKPDAYSRIEDYVGSFAEKPSFEIKRKEYGNTSYQKRSIMRQGVKKRELITVGGGEVSVSDQAKLKIAADFLSKRDFSHAVRFLDILLQENPGNGEGHFLRFLAENACTCERDFVNAPSADRSYESFEKALSTIQDASRREQLYNLLYRHTKERKDLAAYNEYIVLPEGDEKKIGELTDIFFKETLASRNEGVFSEIVKTVTDTDKYINMHLQFARLLSGKKALPYYKNILTADAGNGEAQWAMFYGEHGFSDADTFTFCSNPENSKALEEKLFSYGYNAFANDKLFALCLQFVKQQAEAACNLFDFVLTMIPTQKDSVFVYELTKFLDALFRNGRASYAKKYNELLLARDKMNDTAYFNRVLIKHNYSNPLQLLEISDKLLDDGDFFSAVNAYAEKSLGTKNANSANFYLDLNEKIAALAKEISAPECRKFLGENLYVPLDELPVCRDKAFKALADEANRCMRNLRKTYGVTSDSELFELRVDITHDPDLKRAYLFAKCGKSPQLPEIAHIVNMQGQMSMANNNNALAEERRARNAKLKRGVATFFAWLAILVAAGAIAAVVMALFFSPVLRNFFLVLFDGNILAFYGVSAACIALPFLIFIISLLRWIPSKMRRASGVFMMVLIFGVTGVCAGFGMYKWKGAESGEGNVILGENYVIFLEGDDDDGWAISRYSGDATEVEIPAELNGHEIVEVIGGAFQNNDKLEKITFLGNSLEEIGAYAFQDCDALTTVVLPSSVKTIRTWAFSDCDALTDINLQNTRIEEVDICVFCKSKGLKKISLPWTCEEIEMSAFEECSALEEIYIPSSVTSIGAEALSECSSLKTIKFGGSKSTWSNIRKGNYWDLHTGSYVMQYNG